MFDLTFRDIKRKKRKISNIHLKLLGKHNVLNAKHHEQEARIIAEAGKIGAVTIATNMAGRGTDIKLGGNKDFVLDSGYDICELFDNYEEFQSRLKEINKVYPPNDDPPPPYTREVSDNG